MNKHRLASLALGHKHRNGIDAVPVDREQAYGMNFSLHFNTAMKCYPHSPWYSKTCVKLPLSK